MLLDSTSLRAYFHLLCPWMGTLTMLLCLLSNTMLFFSLRAGRRDRAPSALCVGMRSDNTMMEIASSHSHGQLHKVHALSSTFRAGAEISSSTNSPPIPCCTVSQVFARVSVTLSFITLQVVNLGLTVSTLELSYLLRAPTLTLPVSAHTNHVRASNKYAISDNCPA